MAAVQPAARVLPDLPDHEPVARRHRAVPARHQRPPRRGRRASRTARAEPPVPGALRRVARGRCPPRLRQLLHHAAADRAADRLPVRGHRVARPDGHGARGADRDPGRLLRRGQAAARGRGRRLGAVAGRARRPRLLGGHLARDHLRGQAPLAARRGLRVLLGLLRRLATAPDSARPLARGGSGLRDLAVRAQRRHRRAQRGLLPHGPCRRLVADRGAVAPRPAPP